MVVFTITIAIRSPHTPEKASFSYSVLPVNSWNYCRLTIPSQLVQQGFSATAFINTNLNNPVMIIVTTMSDHLHSLLNNASILSAITDSKRHGNARMQNWKITEIWQRQWDYETRPVTFSTTFLNVKNKKFACTADFRLFLAGPVGLSNAFQPRNHILPWTPILYGRSVYWNHQEVWYCLHRQPISHITLL